MREFLIFCVLGLALPVILLGIAWRRYDRRMKTTLIVPTLSVVLLMLAIQRDLRAMLLGPDYSHRLYTTFARDYSRRPRPRPGAEDFPLNRLRGRGGIRVTNRVAQGMECRTANPVRPEGEFC
jgi:hypothetical protein